MRYEDIDALNYSSLKHMEVSPAYARHVWDHTEEQSDTAARLQGRVIHCACLEPEKFSDRYIVPPIFADCAILQGGKIVQQPNFGDLRYKASKEDKKNWMMEFPEGTRFLKGSEFKQEWFSSLPAGIEVISQADLDAALRCSEALIKNKIARGLLDGAEFEKVIQWEMLGVNCKGRLDAVTTRVLDLKKTRVLSKDACEREAIKYNYHCQLAWYHDGAVKAGLIKGDEPPVIIFLCVDPKSTFVDVIPIIVAECVLDAGRARSLRFLAQYVGFKEMDYWPGAGERMVYLDLPEWKMREDFGE